jgi:hypothetical protein
MGYVVFDLQVSQSRFKLELQKFRFPKISGQAHSSQQVRRGSEFRTQSTMPSPSVHIICTDTKDKRQDKIQIRFVFSVLDCDWIVVA